MNNHTKDRNGNIVKEGSNVKVVAIDPSVINKLNEKEKVNVNSMLGQVFEVEEIDNYGSAWVTKWWKSKESESFSHSLGLSSSEIELTNVK